MSKHSGNFNHDMARDVDGRIRVKSTCKQCGAYKLVSVRDGSLARWESQHVCPRSAWASD